MLENIFKKSMCLEILLFHDSFLGSSPFYVTKRQRIAQLVVIPCINYLEPIQCDVLSSTVRDTGSFGSTNHHDDFLQQPLSSTQQSSSLPTSFVNEEDVNTQENMI